MIITLKFNDILNDFELQYKPFGEHSILIEWPQIISENILENVLTYKQNIEKYNFEQKVYVKSAYNSILITYDVAINNIYDEILVLKSLYLDIKDKNKVAFKLWKIPVCYDLEFGIDLEELSKEKNISILEIIKQHSKRNYRVYFLGFLPGFLYLGGLDNQLHFPRKSNPRLKVNKGSVAIGGSQTGIYPNESPGGWNIIGNTPLNLFNVKNQNPCFAQAGDQIQFISVSKREYTLIASKVEKNSYVLESEVLND